ncbi:DUF6473 family protein [Nitrosomonas sp. Is37]|uniref:DUF6473 family protein n=1 Tax=Nitrosomonas sp. Is37 TaxID=3080535 RepID=UPI00294B05CB|nr:DUF6473 family protein [Nitrosomonas sp. Is37]MDV6344903.1 DUF6473 family protein [Nitrosomonas sp. Is37]
MSKNNLPTESSELVTPPGSKIHFDMWKKFANSSEPHEPDYWILQLLPQHTNFLDIGADIGNSALSAIKVNKTLRITSFEANYALEEYLEETKKFINENDGNFRYYLYGLGSEKKTMDLFVPKVNDWFVIGESSLIRERFNHPVVSNRLSSYSSHGKWSLESGQVSIEKFDDIYKSIFQDENSKFFVKIDVGGFEESVVQGMRNFIKKNNPGFLIALNGERRPCSTLFKLGYEPYFYDHTEKSLHYGFNPDSLNTIYLNRFAIEALHLSDRLNHHGLDRPSALAEEIKTVEVIFGKDSTKNGRSGELKKEQDPLPSSLKTGKLYLAEEFFDQTQEYAIEQFFRTRGEYAALFCDESFYSWFEQHVPNRAFLLQRIEDLEEYNDPQKINLYVLAPYNENEIYKRYGGKFRNFIVRYLLRDVAMALSLRKKPTNFDRDAIAMLPPPEYTLSIICLPRSGSTWLGKILENLGIGKPDEHVRPGLAYLNARFGSCGFSLDVWFHLLIRLYQHNGVFATKFITSFLMMLSSKPSEKQVVEIKWERLGEALLPYQTEAEENKLIQILKKNLGSNHQVICLNRIDKVAQAVSGYIATKSQTWVVGSEAAQKSFNKAVNSIPYEYNTLKYFDEAFFVEEEFRDRFLLRLAKDSGAVIHVDYETFSKETHVMLNTLKLISSRVQFSTDEDTILAAKENTGLIKQSTALNRYFSERYCFDKSFAHLNTEITPNLGYAKQDFNVVDYRLERLGDTELLVRGPIPNLKEDFIVFIGATQTFGRFCTKPFPAQIGEFLELPVLNLGFAGAGPGFFLENEALIEIANKAKFIVVQVMSARSVSAHPFFVDPFNNGVLTNTLTGERKLADLQFNDFLLRESKQAALELRERFRNEYLLKMKSLLQKLNSPKALLLISDNRHPDIETRDFGTNIHNFSSGFPHFVTNPMLSDLATYADYYIEAIGRRGLPQTLISRYTNEPESVFSISASHIKNKDINNYYPSPEMHCDIASSVLKMLSKVSLDHRLP